MAHGQPHSTSHSYTAIRLEGSVDAPLLYLVFRIEYGGGASAGEFDEAITRRDFFAVARATYSMANDVLGGATWTVSQIARGSASRSRNLRLQNKSRPCTSALP